MATIAPKLKVSYYGWHNLVSGKWTKGLSTVPRVPKFARPCSRVRPLWACSSSGRSASGCTAVSSSQSTCSIDKDQDLLSDEVASISSNASPFRKRKVALWVGYVGTAFKGLQLVRGPDSVNTIEFELERAIYQAGGILESNYGHLDKISWSRSSRTDKGVHSLSTVISMKMEIPPSAWLGDPDGLLLADAINVHLPPNIQIFGGVPVTKSFDARRFCCNRTYQYLLPASLLGISGNMSPETIARILESFRSTLKMFEGRFPFHNYTIRRLYRADVRAKAKGSWSKNKNRHRTPVTPKDAEVEEELDEDSDVPAPPVDDPVVKRQNPRTPDGRMAYWLDAPNAADKISASHFRRMLECSCGGLESYSGVQFVRVSITGESFMVHQIRKMVAAAVAVSRGMLPCDIIPISLCRHVRIILPLAPSEGLLLAKNSFYPYRQLTVPASEREFRESDIGVSRLKELPKLQMSRAVADRVETFWCNLLLPELAPLLDGSLPVWKGWEENLSAGAISEAEIEQVRARYISWREESRLQRDLAQKEVKGMAEEPALMET